MRDPETGDILRLTPIGWIPDEWLMPGGIIQTGIFNDHVCPGDPETPGPPGTELRGALRPVFFLRDEFEAWLKGTFELEPSAISENSELVSHRVSAHRRIAAEQAIVALWGNGGPGAGVSERIRERKINKWLKENDRAPVSDATIRRALRELRGDRK